MEYVAVDLLNIVVPRLPASAFRSATCTQLPSLRIPPTCSVASMCFTHCFDEWRILACGRLIFKAMVTHDWIGQKRETLSRGIWELEVENDQYNMLCLIDPDTAFN